MRSLLSFLLFLLVAGSAAAVPMNVDLVIGSGSNGAFQFSWLHEATSSCEVINVSGGDVQFCKNGAKQSVSGTLDATLDGLVLTAISGTIVVSGGPDVIVTDGEFDFGASAADTFGGFLETSTHGTFYFLDHTFAGNANSFDGTTLALWGNNWNVGNPGNPPGGTRWGIDLGMEVVPEPSQALLLAAGLAALGGGRRETRRS